MSSEIITTQPHSNIQQAGNAMESYVFATAQSFEAGQRMANALTKSDLVPKEYRNNLPNTLVALEMSQRTGAGIFAVMQNLYVVHGKPSWSSQFIISAINSCGRFKPLRYDLTGKEGEDSRTCVAWTVERNVELPPEVGTLAQAKDKNVPVLESPPISIAIAKKEGWYQKNGSKWQSMPELMLRYRAATLFGRLYAPEILMGMQTNDEIIDIGKSDYKDVTSKESVLSNINAQIDKERNVTDVEAGEPTEQPPAEEQPQPTPAEETPPQAHEKPVEVDKKPYDKMTQAELKAVGQELLKQLESAGEDGEATAMIFSDANGEALLEYMGNSGLGILAGKIKNMIGIK